MIILRVKISFAFIDNQISTYKFIDMGSYYIHNLSNQIG